MIVDSGSFAIKRKNGFIVLEGVNGAGKGTVKEALAKYLAEKKVDAVFTFEPGGSPLGKSLRPLILGADLNTRTVITELLLISADRSAHVNDVILPALAQGKLVVSDRYYYSSVAFQCFGRGLERKTVDQVNAIATAGVLPDLMILFDLDPLTGLERTKARAGKSASAEKDAFEMEDLSFHRKIREGFLTIAKECGENCIVIDASKPFEAVFREVVAIIERYLSP